MYCARTIALWLFNLICDSAVVIVFWVKQCLCFCHSIQDNLCKEYSTRIICHSLCLFCLLKVAVLVLVAMFYGLCMSGCTCTCMLAGFLQLKPLMKTVCFAYVAVGQVSWRLSKSPKQIYSTQMKMTMHKSTSKECNLKILVISNFSHVFFFFNDVDGSLCFFRIN